MSNKGHFYSLIKMDHSFYIQKYNSFSFSTYFYIVMTMFFFTGEFSRCLQNKKFLLDCIQMCDFLKIIFNICFSIFQYFIIFDNQSLHRFRYSFFYQISFAHISDKLVGSWSFFIKIQRSSLFEDIFEQLVIKLYRLA